MMAVSRHNGQVGWVTLGFGLYVGTGSVDSELSSLVRYDWSASTFGRTRARSTADGSRHAWRADPHAGIRQRKIFYACGKSRS